jgi:hypothetical protein
MLLDFEVQRCTRRCAATENPLEPGDVCYSVLLAEGADVIRKDFSSQAWSGAPEGSLGWWKSRIPESTAKKIKLAPNDVLLQLFEQLANRPEQSDLRYVLALLLIRRRVLRLDFAELESDELPAAEGGNHEQMIVYCPKQDRNYEVVVDMPTGNRIDEIQEQLSQLLIADAV